MREVEIFHGRFVECVKAGEEISVNQTLFQYSIVDPGCISGDR
jgi:hypothetical protein